MAKLNFEHDGAKYAVKGEWDGNTFTAQAFKGKKEASDPFSITKDAKAGGGFFYGGAGFRGARAPRTFRFKCSQMARCQLIFHPALLRCGGSSRQYRLCMCPT